jgi:hypothetical protein
MRNFSPYWRMKLVDWITAPWIPTEIMKDVREVRRIIEVMDRGSKKAFAEKKAALEDSATSFSSQRKDMMNIMRQFSSVRARNLLMYTSQGKLCVVQLRAPRRHRVVGPNEVSYSFFTSMNILICLIVVSWYLLA